MSVREVISEVDDVPEEVRRIGGFGRLPKLIPVKNMIAYIVTYYAIRIL